VIFQLNYTMHTVWDY